MDKKAHYDNIRQLSVEIFEERHTMIGLYQK